MGVTHRSTRRVALAILAGCMLGLPGCDGAEVDGSVLTTLPVPAEHARGAAVYRTHCEACHGEHALGTEIGPPLVHPVYRPRHHGDAAFELAVSQGVRAHHWRFGDMAPVPGIPPEDVAAVTAYVRWLQRAVGIE
jgi:mono/diheme cytochrome c family protein